MMTDPSDPDSHGSSLWDSLVEKTRVGTADLRASLTA